MVSGIIISKMWKNKKKNMFQTTNQLISCYLL